MITAKASSSWKTAGLFGLKLLFTVVCLCWAFSSIDGKRFGAVVEIDLRFAWLAGALACAGLSVFFTALRWWLFLRALKLPVAFSRALSLTFIGNLFGLVSVGGVGSGAARIVLLMRDHPGKKLLAAMSVLTDYLAGMVTLAVMFFVVSAARFHQLAAPSVLGERVIHFAWIFFAGALVGVGVMFLMASPRVRLRVERSGVLRRWPMIERMPQIQDVFRREWPLSLAALASGFLMLMSYFGSFACALFAVGASSGGGSIFVAMPVIDSLSALPVSVAGVGVREKAFEILMQDLAGIPAAMAISTSLLGFACHVVWVLPGAWLMLKKRRRDRVVSDHEIRRTSLPSMTSAPQE